MEVVSTVLFITFPAVSTVLLITFPVVSTALDTGPVLLDPPVCVLPEASTLLAVDAQVALGQEGHTGGTIWVFNI